MFFRSYSFIRGQNAPIDPNILAERTTKRIKALELQKAIKAQVEERERLRKLELEKSLLEERQQEENLRQQIESSEQRFEEEQRKAREKSERDQRKQEMMRIAIEKARQDAEMERKKKRSACASAVDDDDDNGDQECHNERLPEHEKSTINESEILPKSPIHLKADVNEKDVDDGEQILIGTPIKMRKKTLNKTYKIPVSAKKEVPVQSDREPATAPETNVDGIALVLQTLPPIMPILSNDIINLNQNINNLNTSNIQLAVMLAHQMQQLNSMAQNQNPNPNPNPVQLPDLANTKINAQDTNSTEETLVSSTRSANENSPTNDVCKQCTTHKTSSHDDEKVNVLFSNSRTRVFFALCISRICLKLTLNFAFLFFVGDRRKIAAKDQAQTKDAATVTEDFDAALPNKNQMNAKDIFDEVKPKIEMSHVADASTQTDKKLEYCFQCRYHHCHHHHVIVKDLESDCVDDVRAVAVNHATLKSKCSDKECASASIGNRTVCNDPKEPIKIEDRPKWGVNRVIDSLMENISFLCKYFQSKNTFSFMCCSHCINM